MKILFIYGDDYSATHVEGNLGITKAIELTVNNDGYYNYVNEDEGINADLEIREFGDVDTDFVNFIQNELRDGNQKETKNFFIID